MDARLIGERLEGVCSLIRTFTIHWSRSFSRTRMNANAKVSFAEYAPDTWLRTVAND